MSLTSPAPAHRHSDRVVSPGRTLARMIVHLFGVVAAVAATLGLAGPYATQTPAIVLTLIACALWCVAAFYWPRLSDLQFFRAWSLIVILGGVAGGLGSGGASIVVPVAVFVLLGSPWIPIPRTLWVGAIGLAGYLIARLFAPGIEPNDLPLLISLVGVVGVSLMRRMASTERAADRALLVQRAETAALAERTRLARDLHDVLAHSLGGLVMQLDAIDVIAEAQSADPALRERIRGARTLAQEGLEDARRAVAALRESGSLAEALDTLKRHADALGHAVTIETEGDLDTVPAAVTEALRAAVTEALTNARKHAPGAPSNVRVETSLHRVLVRISTGAPVAGAAGSAIPSGSHGLGGLRERFDALGGTLSAGEVEGDWVVFGEIEYR
ncbi:sensor histidine kinase [Mycetocola sp. JXN-3]|uniref:sensor histidine kinase n=1 Tax=Mycetocola sp. JXN-3 TaxID=2116510 RepID=UPI00165CFB27|nr:histidine kinase [Mycetocola sp. JXN-3]